MYSLPGPLSIHMKYLLTRIVQVHHLGFWSMVDPFDPCAVHP